MDNRCIPPLARSMFGFAGQGMPGQQPVAVSGTRFGLRMRRWRGLPWLALGDARGLALAACDGWLWQVGRLLHAVSRNEHNWLEAVMFQQFGTVTSREARERISVGSVRAARPTCGFAERTQLIGSLCTAVVHDGSSPLCRGPSWRTGRTEWIRWTRWTRVCLLISVSRNEPNWS